MKFRVKTPSRIHMSLLDLNGALGRIDGGFGLALQSPNFVIMFSDECKEGLSFQGPSQYNHLVEELIENLSSYYGVHYPNLEIVVEEKIDEHMGLGSKTQFLMAIALGLCNLRQIEYEIKDLAKIIKRGGTSGVGYMAFETGKFIIDLGHSFGLDKEKKSFLPSSASNSPPALPFVQIPFPPDWDIILITPAVKPGANNTEEVNIFQKYCPISKLDVESISHRLLMELIPSVLTHDIKGLASAITFISNHGFKKIEISLQHEYVQKLISFISNNFEVPVGMSSFGPTIYVISNEKSITDLIIKSITKFQDTNQNAPEYKLSITKPNNSGFLIFE